jgi:hypothetical protein
MARPDTPDVGQHGGELDIGILQRLLDALDMTGRLAHQLLTGAQLRAHLLCRRFRYETGADQAVRQQLGEPLRVGHIGLAARHVLHMRGVGQDQGEVTVRQDVPDRLPVDTCRLRRDVSAALFGQPLR